ncbi:MAG TPA: amidohydrolase family protein [Segetibacter sp.]
MRIVSTICLVLIVVTVVAQSTLIKNVSIIPMNRENIILKNQDVLITNGLIKAIGDAGTIKRLNKYIVIDGKGKFLMPSFVDMHVHLERFTDKKDLMLFLINGVTMVRNMDGRPEILEWKRNVKNQSLIGPEIRTGGPILEGKRPFWQDTEKVTSKEEAEKAVEEHKKLGYDFIKVYFTLSKDVYYAILKHAKGLGIDVVGHIPNSINIEEAMIGGQKSIEHLDGYEDWIEAKSSPSYNKYSWLKPYFAMQVDASQIKTAVDLGRKYDTWNCPTLIVKNKLAAIDTLKMWHREAQNRLVPGYMLDGWKPELFTKIIDSISGEEWQRIYRGKKVKSDLVYNIFKANGKILLGTDTPNPFVIPGYAVHEELQNLVDAGLSNYEALLCATSKPAEFFKETASWGTIEKGKQANIILLNANPLKKISHSKLLYGVLIKGKFYLSNELQKRYKGNNL